MDRRRLTIPLAADESVSAILTLPPDKKQVPGIGVITAHGAGNDMANPLLAAFTDGLAKAGYPALRFNFPYKEKGLKMPDRPEKLEDTWAAVCRYFREDSGVDVTRIIAAGKSMGGRIASQMAAEKILPAEGLIFLGYPLIQDRSPDALFRRDERQPVQSGEDANRPEQTVGSLETGHYRRRRPFLPRPQGHGHCGVRHLCSNCENDDAMAGDNLHP